MGAPAAGEIPRQALRIVRIEEVLGLTDYLARLGWKPDAAGQ